MTRDATTLLGTATTPAAATGNGAKEHPTGSVSDAGSIAVLVAGAIRLYRDGVSMYLRSLDRFRVVGGAANGTETIERVRDLTPEIVLLDLAMPESVATIRQIRQETNGVRVVALGLPETEQPFLQCVEAGIAGCVLRDASLQDLANVLESVARNELLVSPRLAGSLLRRISRLPADDGHADHARLTPREKQVVELISQGLSNKQIANRLHIRLATVKNHVHNILDKLRLRRRGEIPARLRNAT